ncbi:MAG TPA: 50S ribosomal protein L17 [Actinomycetota bacterium]|nr:50S ribosomal protein L17 [Actinomycetota bacterium]
MPKPPKGARLGAGPAHDRLMIAGLAAALFREERIRTTETRARRLRPVAERLITMGKEGTLASRRRALAVVEDRDIIHKLYSDIAPRFADRQGGYTRIVKLAPRKGDAAPMVLIEIVEGAAPETKPAEEERRRRLLRRRGRARGEAPREAPREGGRSQEIPEASEEAEAPPPAPAPPAPAPVQDAAAGVEGEEDSDPSA